MATDLTVRLESRPGTLADLGEALGSAGVNIDAIAAFDAGGRGVAHVVVADPERARSVLEQAGMTVESVREALTTTLRNEPGETGKFARKLADAGVNVEAHYSVFGTDQVVFVVDDIEKARAAAA
jgi:hypothetical protein